MNQKDQAIELIRALSELFKLGLGKGQEEITVGDELSYIENYLFIHRIRYGDEFDYKIMCEEYLKSGLIIRLLIQPLVENAIYHGIDETENERGQIEVLTLEEDSSLIIKVRNYPSRLRLSEINHLNTCLSKYKQDSAFGIGLVNVNERIRLSYGKEYGLRFSLEEGWTVVTVRIPLTFI